MLEIRKKRFGQQRSIHEQQRSRRTLRRTVVVVFILIFVMVVAGVLYVWYMGQHPVQVTTQKIDTSSAAPTIKTYTPAPDAPVSIVLQAFSDTVASGSNASISIKTNPKAACQIGVKVNNTPIPDTGLIPKNADEFGLVNWSWTVPKNVVTGTIPVEITCANEAKKSAYYRADLKVTSPSN